MNKYIILVTFIIHLYMNFVIFMLKNQHFGNLIDILTYLQTRVPNTIDTPDIGPRQWGHCKK